MAFNVESRFKSMNLDKKKPSGFAYYLYCIAGTFFLLYFLVSIIACIALWHFGPVLLGFPCAVMSFFYLKMAQKYRSSWWKHKNEYETKKAEEQKIRFYNECLKQGVRHMQSPAYRQKAKLIAKQLDLQIQDAVTYFEAASRVVEEKKCAALKNSEYQTHSALIHYAEYIGHEKKVAMMRDLITVKNDRISELLNPAVNAEFSRKSEHDWAIHGGIVSGIAGSAAGLAAAVRVSQQNAQIRQDNARLTELQYQYLRVVAGDIQKLKEQIQELEEQISSHQTKVISDTGGGQIMSNLTITVQETSISQTGAFLVKASVKCNSPVKIYNELPGVIDGTIAADIYQEKQLVGTALMSLPIDGVSSKPVIVEGMILSGADRSKGYKIKFRHHHLWEIEQ